MPNREVIVCKTAMIRLHGIGRKLIERICTHMSVSVTAPPDLRGKHLHRPKIIPPNLIQQVNDHIKSFRKRESHYGREKSHKFYLSPELNIKIMHQLYLKKYENHNYELLQQGENVKPLITYDYFFRYFKENFNYSFGRSRTDTCKKCDLLDNKLKSTLDEEEKNALKAEKEVHLKKSEWFYRSLREHTKEAQENEEVEVLCFDFQQNSPLPKVPSAELSTYGSYGFTTFVYILPKKYRPTFICMTKQLPKREPMRL